MRKKLLFLRIKKGTSNLIKSFRYRTSKWKVKSKYSASKRLKENLKRNYLKTKIFKNILINKYFRFVSLLSDPKRIEIREKRYKKLKNKFELYASLGRYKNPIGTHLLFFPTMFGTLSVLPLAQFLTGYNLFLSFACKRFCI